MYYKLSNKGVCHLTSKAVRTAERVLNETRRGGGGGPETETAANVLNKQLRTADKE